MRISNTFTGLNIYFTHEEAAMISAAKVLVKVNPEDDARYFEFHPRNPNDEGNKLMKNTSSTKGNLPIRVRVKQRPASMPMFASCALPLLRDAEGRHFYAPRPAHVPPPRHGRADDAGPTFAERQAELGARTAPSPGGPQTSEVILMTPAMAVHTLETNLQNRKISDARVKEFVRIIEEGLWMLTHQGVAVSTEGNLIDGQHRLWAIVESDTPVEIVVTRNVTPDAYKVIDTGRVRTAGHALEISGAATKDSTIVAAAARLCINYLNDHRLSSRRVPTHQEVVAYVEENPGLIEWVSRARGTRYTKGWGSPLGAVLYLGSRREALKADAFMEQVTSGANLAEGSPTLILRNRIAMSPQEQRRRPLLEKASDGEQRFVAVALMWNVHVLGNSRTILRAVTEAPIIMGA